MGKTERWLTTGYGFDCVSRVEPSFRLMVEVLFNALWQALPAHHRAIVPPEVVVMSSVRAFTHTMYPHSDSPHGIHSLVFDEGLYKDLVSLTHHLVLESPAHLVDVLLMKVFARRLVLEDRRLEAAAVGIFTNELVMQHRGGRQATDSEERTRASFLQGQLLFTLAHEIFHTILKDKNAEGFFRDSIEYHVRDYMARLEVIVELQQRRSDPDGAQAGDEPFDALVDVFRLPSRERVSSRSDRYRSHLELMRTMMRRPGLRDEFICDLYASLLTVRVQESSGLPTQFTLATCVLALENLAIVRFLAREAADARTKAEDLLSEAAARVSMLTGALSAELIWQGERHNQDRRPLLERGIERPPGSREPRHMWRA